MDDMSIEETAEFADFEATLAEMEALMRAGLLGRPVMQLTVTDDAKDIAY